MSFNIKLYETRLRTNIKQPLVILKHSYKFH